MKFQAVAANPLMRLHPFNIHHKNSVALELRKLLENNTTTLLRKSKRIKLKSRKNWTCQTLLNLRINVFNDKDITE